MPVEVKICGLKTAETVEAAVLGGARYVGFVFFGPSPRNLDGAQAARLASLVPAGVAKVGLFVEPGDVILDSILGEVDLDMVQLHGSESPGRVAAVKALTGCAVIKAVPLSGPADLESARAFEGAADRLLFDAKPAHGEETGRPGGNALSFDWSLLAGQDFALPWMLAGGLDAGNLAQAMAESGADTVDISSGVEDGPGEKNADKIKAFLAAAAELP